MSPFEAIAADGSRYRSRASGNRNLVLFFYPRDMTPGCTTEARQFRDLHAQFAAAGTDIVGVSRDTQRSHARFIERESLPFVLLADESETLCRQFDVIREKSMYGRKVIGIERSTFLIDGSGRLAREWRKVRVDGHAREVLAAAQAL